MRCSARLELLYCVLENTLRPRACLREAAGSTRGVAGSWHAIVLMATKEADLIIPKHRSFSEIEFSRREATDFFGAPTAIASLEDVIHSKLEWAKMGASDRPLLEVPKSSLFYSPEFP